jgi:uncharacterized ion transporter superfamily protein YfcC
MIVIIIAAISTWLLPAGEYNNLSVNGKSFVITSPSGENTLPLTQKTEVHAHSHAGRKKWR